MDWKSQIDKDRIPQHIAIIMDGNGRWAKEKGKPRVFGHSSGVTSVRQCSEAGAELGLQCMTLYAFSTENWNRPKLEVNALMTLLVNTIRAEVKTMMDNNIKLWAIGEIDRLPSKAQSQLREAIQTTRDNTGMTLNLALNYSGKWDLTQAARKVAARVAKGELSAEEVTEEVIGKELSTYLLPDPELMIRTSGELRISNFLLWQLAYSELYFTDTFWPDFRKDDLYKAIVNYQNRERRFGKTSEQLVQ